MDGDAFLHLTAHFIGARPRVWPPRRRGDSGTANVAAPKDSTTRAAKDGPVWSHCSAPAVRYGGKCGADSAHASHSENEPSMKGLIIIIIILPETCQHQI